MPNPLLNGLLDLLFPPRCAGCSRPGSWFCPDCAAQVAWIWPPLCARCGEPVPAGSRCPRLGRHPDELAGLRSAAWHTGPLRIAIHRLKYRGQRVLAVPLASILIGAWRREAPAADLLLPVPLHARRLRERGFNQAALLASELGHATGIAVDSRSLQRLRHTPPQVGLGAAERLLNVRGAFGYRGPRLEGRTVCLIDDICTTSATLQACAEALRDAGAGPVWAFTLARPQWEVAQAADAGG